MVGLQSASRVSVLDSVLVRVRDPRSSRPDPGLVVELESELDRLYARDRLVYIGVLLAIAFIWGVGWIVVVPFSPMAVSIVTVLTWLLSWALCYRGQRKVVKPERASPRLLGRYDAASLRALFHEANEPFRSEYGDRLPALYVTESTDVNAFAQRALVLSFVPRLNAVIVDSGMLAVLERAELRSVLAHELAHFHRYMSVFNQHFGAPLLLTSSAFVWGAALLATSLGAADPVDLTLSWVVAAAFLHTLGRDFLLSAFLRLESPSSQIAELLCDHRAARSFGVVPEINVRIKLGISMEIDQILQEEIANVIETDTEHDVEEVYEAAERALPAQLLSRDKVRGALRQELASLRGERSIFRPPLKDDPDLEERRALVREIRRDSKRLRRTRYLSWERFDRRVRDRYLDSWESRDYLEAMLRDGCATIARAIDELEIDPDGSHPNARDRLLFLASTLPIEND